jgi:hypothetical protein
MKVDVGLPVNEEALLRLASLQAIGSHTDRRDATPQPDCTRDKLLEIERSVLMRSTRAVSRTPLALRRMAMMCCFTSGQQPQVR